MRPDFKMTKKQTILDSALNLFITKGFEGTSVREIAAEAGVNVAMINYYFGSKEKLFESIVEERASVLQTVFTELLQNKTLTPMEKMDIIIDQTIERKWSHSQFNHLLHRELSLEHRPQLRNSISEILFKNMKVVKKIIQDGIKDGVFQQVDVELTLATLAGTIFYLLSSDTMCRKILNKKDDFHALQNKQLKKRLSDHIKQLMRSHLLKK